MLRYNTSGIPIMPQLPIGSSVTSLTYKNYLSDMVDYRNIMQQISIQMNQSTAIQPSTSGQSVSAGSNPIVTPPKTTGTTSIPISPVNAPKPETVKTVSNPEQTAKNASAMGTVAISAPVINLVKSVEINPPITSSSGTAIQTIPKPVSVVEILKDVKTNIELVKSGEITAKEFSSQTKDDLKIIQGKIAEQKDIIIKSYIPYILIGCAVMAFYFFSKKGK